MSTKIAINGFGRIGRTAFRKIIDNYADLDVVAINDLADPKILAHLLKYDSVYGVYDRKVKSGHQSITVDKKEYQCLAEKDPAQLPWKSLGVDVVLECTGLFAKYEKAQKHLEAGAKKVIVSAPCQGSDIPTYILGGNEEKYDADKDKIISMGSCTTNCYVPITKILHENFRIERGFMVTAHAATNNQKVLDSPHHDLRRARSVFDNIIPTTSGSDQATTEVIPELKGKLHTMAMRVPVRVGSVIYAIYDLEKKPSPDEVNQIIQKASQGKYKKILKYETAPIVSSDIIGSSYSAIFDSLLTEQSDDLIKIIAWYDNEYGYASRLAEMAEFIG